MNQADIAWMLVSTALVLLMTPALAFFYGGLVRSKNSLNTMMMSFVSLGAVGVLWALLGYSFAFAPGGPFIGGLDHALLRGVNLEAKGTIPHVLFMCFQGTFAIITAALISGAIVERMRFTAYLLFISLWTLFVYSPVCHWVWASDGWLFTFGALDFAGGTVVHVNAGIAALVAAVVLGPRKDYARQAFLPHNVPFALLGAGLLWFGWFGFNAGSALGATPAAALAFATTMLAPAAALLVWTLLDLMRNGKITAVGAATGIVVGLVAITPAAGFVSIAASIVIGVVAAGASNMALYWKSRSSIDDTLDVFPCHGVGGMAGMVLTAVFARDGGLITGSPVLFMKHLAALCLVSAFTFGGSWLLYKLVDMITPLRVDERHEQLGLDLSQHGESVSLFDYDEARS
jgi:Amt family ammonium transporter